VTQPDLCFDLSHKPGTKVELISDPKMSVFGTVFRPSENDGIYFENIEIVTKNNISITAEATRWDILDQNDQLRRIEPVSDAENSTLTFDDMIVSRIIRTKNGFKFNVTILDGPTFE